MHAEKDQPVTAVTSCCTQPVGLCCSTIPAIPAIPAPRRSSNQLPPPNNGPTLDTQRGNGVVCRMPEQVLMTVCAHVLGQGGRHGALCRSPAWRTSCSAAGGSGEENICCLAAHGLTLKMREDSTSRQMLSLKKDCQNLYGCLEAQTGPSDKRGEPPRYRRRSRRAVPCRTAPRAARRELPAALLLFEVMGGVREERPPHAPPQTRTHAGVNEWSYFSLELSVLTCGAVLGGLRTAPRVQEGVNRSSPGLA
ncbi:hypothetical protein P4O66_014370 [Electrophorus voltai]|uniref:Uncharacterized protein n=1 Tax=Electrophorus voltai TaxID=2609070 RepID=A0AAD8Z005_9TELE|nr:hypothetical protein P4O66_014370 [Electrophorus voltai]